MRLLNIVSSPRGAKSVSIAVANAFLDAYCTASPSTEVDTLNVWEENLPDFDSQAIGAKYKRGIKGANGQLRIVDLASNTVSCEAFSGG